MTQSLRTNRKTTDKEANEMASNDIEVLDPAASIEKIRKTGVALNRRHFMTALGVAGVAAGTGLLSSPVAHAQQPTPNGFQQVDVLNFLLNLKYLKATFYSYITQGTDLPPAVTVGTGALYNPPNKISFSTQQITDLFNEMYFDELNQLSALIAILGVAAAPRADMDLSGAGTDSNTGTIPISQAQAIGVAQTLEDLTTSAFAYALSYLTGDYLAHATQAFAVSGFHSGAVRLIGIQASENFQYQGSQSYTFPAGATANSNIVYGIFPAATPPQVGYVVSVAPTSVGTNFPPYTTYTVPGTVVTNYYVSGLPNKQLVTEGAGFSGLATITAVPASIPSSYKTSYSLAKHTDSFTVSAADAAAFQVGMPVTDYKYIPNGAIITAINTTTNTVTISAGPGGHPSYSLYVGTSAITLSTAYLYEGGFTLATLGFLGDDPDTVLPADIGSGVATTGPALTPPNPVYQGFFDTTGSTDATAQTPAGLAFARTFSQVLAILYNNSATSTYEGGYFPVGVAGSINVV